MGDDVRFWTLAALFGLDLLSRQRFIPTVAKVGKEYLARWQPLLRTSSAQPPADNGKTDDWARFVGLAQAMPPACRCLEWTASSPQLGPRGLLMGYLEAVADAVPRESGAPDELSIARPRTAVERWLNALGAEPVLEGDSKDLAAFHKDYKAWSDPVEKPVSATDTFRVCFRLEPPVQHTVADTRATQGTAAQDWSLQFMLQATDDPSLLVPAATVWKELSSTARFVNRRFDNPQERLLAGLGHASRLFQPIDTSLKTARPEDCRLTTQEAYDFVREKALVLKSSGFGVLVPGLEAKLGLRARLGRKSQGTGSSQGLFNWQSIVEYDWQVALGGELLSREEFEALAKLKEPLVQVRGRWIELRPEQIEQALAFFQRQRDSAHLSLTEAISLALGPNGEGGLAVVEVVTEGWIDELMHQLRDGGHREELAEPEGFVGRLRGYQKTGLSWLVSLRRYGLGACLADDMGLGKTIQIIAALLHGRSGVPGDQTGPALLICPTSVVGNWRHELARFAPSLRVLVHHGAARNKDEFATEASAHDVVISTYALLHRDEAELTGVEWSHVILDEAQNIKNAGTRAAQAARKLKAGWRAAMTGTPVENRLADLWSIFQFLNPGYLGSAEEFKKRFARPIERAHDPKATARLKALVSPFVLRRVKTDRSIIQDLPEKSEMKVFCTLTKEQATLYEAVVQDSLRQIEEAEGLQRRGLVLATLTKLKQVCNHPAQFLHDRSDLEGRSGKLARLQEMLEEIFSVGDRALVFSQFAEMGRMIKEHLETRFGHEVLFLFGGTPAAERDRMVARFQSEGRGPSVFILSLKAGGIGLNLTRASHVFHFDRWWNPAVENQATDRAFRIGQSRNVLVHKFICGGTFEEGIDQLIERKTELSDAIVGAGETWITEMSTEELRDLFTLRRDAAGEE
ncbi:MAG: DEAD/DEAH box helicase [Chloroflexi bacterium]|nr:DEAD/DEAH box helicase [Chloroflexota bacterium]